MFLQRELSLKASLRESVIVLAQAASAAILQVYEHAFEVRHKADASPLTQADLASHQLIVSGLERLTPGISILSEESAEEVLTSVRRTWRQLWVVDPLDGTREFVKRNGEFTVNIALIDEGVPIFGVIQAPISGTIWHAQHGNGAFRRDGLHESPIQSAKPAHGPLKVAASRSHRDPRTQAILDQIEHAVPVALGSSLKFCRIAEGQMDVYPRFGPTSEWDTAAGQCILEAAGGSVIDARGRPFRYNQRDTVLNGDFIALGDSSLPWQTWMGASV